MKTIQADDINAILPQTQCGLCEFDGCKPYAEALAQGKATINLCPPGGIKGLLALADLLNQSAEPYLDNMQKITKPPTRAVIREAECIGCTKCIKACPVDAILGSGKHMHTVITDECTGCELCIAPCPVDCIDMVTTDDVVDRTFQYRSRYEARNHRLQKVSELESAKPRATATDLSKTDYIKKALARVKAKKK